jgi:hypothetical protein
MQQKPIYMEDISDLKSRLRSESETDRLTVISKLAAVGDSGINVLIEWLESYRDQTESWSVGQAYQTLYLANTPQAKEFLQTAFPDGVIPLESQRNIDYRPLQQLLAKQDFQAADVLTLQKMCELAGQSALERQWLYFTEVDNFPAVDLHTLDKLWLIHSEGKFGFSVQRKIWLSVGKDFAKLWYKIGWKTDNNWTRYPQEFTWNLSAPNGHLPLSNQLRGVRVIASIFAHPAWQSTNS